MSTGEIEQRLVALEETVANLRAQMVLSAAADAALPNGALLNGVEYPTALAQPPRESVRLRGSIASIRRGRQDLALSDGEWSSIIPEQSDA